MRHLPRLLTLAGLWLAANALAQERRNWFDDPFFQISSAVAHCPLPAGPFITEAERRVQAHHRAEKGSSCWLAGLCDRPNFYAYDQGIAQALRSSLVEQPQPALLADTSLWLTVQARVVYIEGCVPDATRAAALERWARSIAQVQAAIALVYSDPQASPPYRR